MKIKQDFITNSSSSSFIVSGETTKEIAEKMTIIVFAERLDYAPVNKDYEKKILKTIKNLKDDENIMLPFTCNYETFISKNKDGEIFVDTCRNHDWENELDITNHFGEEGNEKEEKYQSKLEFINIETGERGNKKKLSEIIYKKLMEKIKEKKK